MRYVLMNKRWSFFATLLMMSTPAFAAITLTTPEEIKIAAINGQEVNTGLFSSNKKAHQLKTGENVISVRYSQYFEENRNIGTHEIVRSNIVNIKTPLLDDNQTYYLSLIDTPENVDAARDYAKQPVFGLYNSKNQLLVKQQGAQTSSLGIVSNLFVEGESINRNQANIQPSPEYTAQAKLNLPKEEISTDVNVKGGQDQRLIQIWKSASKAERQKFLTWLAEQ